MAISNLELRRKMFGEDGAGPGAKPSAARDPVRLVKNLRGALADFRDGFASAFRRNGPKTPVASAPADRLADRLAAAARAKARPETTERLAYADAAKGLATMLAIFLAVAGMSGTRYFGIGWIDTLAQFLHPFAIPAFLVFAGMFLRRSREAEWAVFLRRKIWPLALALLLWGAATALLAKANLLPRPGGASAHLHLVVLLLVLPAFLLLWRALRNFRTGTIFVFAAIAEILHTEYGGILWIEAMRGMAYVAAGHVFAHHLHRLARFARENRPAALAMIGAWAALGALLTYADVPAAPGARIATLPFASLALGLAGAGAIAIAGALISATRFNAAFATLGRNWIAFYATAPLVIVALGAAMRNIGLFATAQEAVAALLVAIFAAGAALLALELREPQSSPQRPGLRNL